MKIYIAGSSKEIHRAERFIALARENGHTITEDWAAGMRAAGPESALERSRLTEAAAADLRGIRDADVMWLLIPPVNAPSTGCWGELTYAMALGTPIIASRPTDKYEEAMQEQFNIFLYLVPETKIFANDRLALASLGVVR